MKRVGMAKTRKAFIRKAKTRKTPYPKCQCYREGTQQGCKSRALTNSLFCKKHQNCDVPPLTGFEPIYSPGKWNQDPAVQKSHNCYSYAMDFIDPKLVEQCRQDNADSDKCRARFHQPGSVHGERDALDTKERRNCKALDRLIRADNPGIIKSSFYENCPSKTSKIYMTVDEGEDFHFYEQNPPELIAHNTKNTMHTLPLYSDKGGSNPAKRIDATGSPIFNPELASRDFRGNGSRLNYEDSCGFYCVPRDGSVRLASSGGGRSRRAKRARQY